MLAAALAGVEEIDVVVFAIGEAAAFVDGPRVASLSFGGSTAVFRTRPVRLAGQAGGPAGTYSADTVYMRAGGFVATAALAAY